MLDFEGAEPKRMLTSQLIAVVVGLSVRAGRGDLMGENNAKFLDAALDELDRRIPIPA